MRPWLIMLGSGLALVGPQAVQAQVTIDITENHPPDEFERRAEYQQFINTLSVWLNGPAANGMCGNTLIDPLSPGRIALVHYCEDHTDALVLDAARNVFGADK